MDQTAARGSWEDRKAGNDEQPRYKRKLGRLLGRVNEVGRLKGRIMMSRQGSKGRQDIHEQAGLSRQLIIQKGRIINDQAGLNRYR